MINLAACLTCAAIATASAGCSEFHFESSGPSTRQPDPPVVPSPPPQAARVTAGGADRGGRVYLCLSAAGWPRAWSEYNDPKNVFVDPRRPVEGANVRYWLTSQAQLAVRMQVDGLVFTTPHVPPPAEIETRNAQGKIEKTKNPDAWRMRFEGRMDAVRNGSPMGDAQAIADGLREARRILLPPAEIILYTGYPDDRDKSIVTDEAKCDKYVNDSIGAYVNVKDASGAYIVSRVVVDTVGAYVNKPEAQAVLKSIRRQYPWLKVGGEPQPHKATFQFDTGVTTRAAWKNVHKGSDRPEPEWGVLSDEYVPVKTMAATGCAPIIFYTEGPRLDLDEVVKQVTAAPVSIGVFAWTVGMDTNGPKQPGDTERWLRFMARMRELRKKWDAPLDPPR